MTSGAKIAWLVGAALLLAATALQVVSLLGAEPATEPVAEGEPESPSRLYALVRDRALDGLLTPGPKLSTAVRAVVLPLDGDDAGDVGRRLAERLRGDGRFRVVDEGYALELAAEYDPEGELRAGGPAGLATLGKKIGAEVAVGGRVLALRDDADEARLDVHLYVVDLVDGAVLAERAPAPEAIARSVASLDYLGLRMKWTSALYRGFLWFLWVAILPWLAAPALVDLLKRQSNDLNALVMAAFTALALVFAWALRGFEIGGVGGVAVLGAAGVVAFLVTLADLDALDELR